jgi:branched-chain amino acid transport system ATP-binding protein
MSEYLNMGCYPRRNNEGIAQDIEKISNLFTIIPARSEQTAVALPGGEQQLLAFRRALTVRAKMLFLDEPSKALSPILIGQISNLIKKINQTDTTNIPVEQHASLRLKTAGQGYVVETGRAVFHAKTERLPSDTRVKTAYLNWPIDTLANDHPETLGQISD